MTKNGKIKNFMYYELLGLSPVEVVKEKRDFSLKCMFKDLDGKQKYIYVYDNHKKKADYEEMLQKGKKGIVVADRALIDPFQEMTFSAVNLRIKETNHEEKV